MHDIRRLREQADLVKANIKRKGFDADTDAALALDKEWRELTTKGDQLKAELNKASKAIGMAKKAGRDAAEEMEAARQVRDNISATDERKKVLEEQIRILLQSWPAEPDTKAPEGLTAEQNIVASESGEKPSFDFNLLDHLELGEKLDILDMPRGSKITGSGFPVYKGHGATLERALIQFMLDTHIREHGYTELFVPFMANRDSVLGTGQLPKLEEDMYYINKDEFYLIPTAEVPITNMHRDDTLRHDELPVKYVAYSPCFRREAGTYGADTRGLLRIHQFNKVELVHIVDPEKSEAAQLEILSHALKILDTLGITWRVLDLCAGDMSFAAARCFDIEVWAPGTGRWLEASSVSNFRDFQARRMNLRVKIPTEKKPVFPHTLNGSGLATSRLMVALMETWQTPENRIRIPKPLQPYMNGLDQIRGKAG